MIKKTPKGWLVDVQPGGRGFKRYRKTFKAKVDALQWERNLPARNAALVESPSKHQAQAKRLSQLVDLWQDLHGINLKAANTYSRLKLLVKALGDPVATDFRASDFASYRASRIAQGINPATLNRERSYLVAVFSELSRLGHWEGDNPLAKLRPIRVDQIELSYLGVEQIKRLFVELKRSDNPDVFLVSKVALSTGARWSEVQALRLRDVTLEPSMLAFHRTKSGKSRFVPVDRGLAGDLAERLAKGSFAPSYSAFRTAVGRAGLELPSGQLAHVLRHTFASHFVQRGGDLLTLQRLLGHSTIQVTMRYAHLSSSALDAARLLNPLAGIFVG